jgi:hypothetical protein
MAIHMTQLTVHARGGPQFSVHSIDLHAQGAHASPVIMIDDFGVEGRPFQPHPHAGFSAVTYVFEDSPGGLRSSESPDPVRQYGYVKFELQSGIREFLAPGLRTGWFTRE